MSICVIRSFISSGFACAQGNGVKERERVRDGDREATLTLAVVKVDPFAKFIQVLYKMLMINTK